MKSITQIDLGCLTERKSLSKSDSGRIQATHLIATGGAISLPLSFHYEVAANSFFFFFYTFPRCISNTAQASGIFSKCCQMKCKLACRRHHIWLNYSLKSLYAVFTIKMNNCHHAANFFCMRRLVAAKIYISK